MSIKTDFVNNGNIYVIFDSFMKNNKLLILIIAFLGLFLYFSSPKKCGKQMKNRLNSVFFLLFTILILVLFSLLVLEIVALYFGVSGGEVIMCSVIVLLFVLWFAGSLMINKEESDKSTNKTEKFKNDKQRQN